MPNSAVSIAHKNCPSYQTCFGKIRSKRLGISFATSFAVWVLFLLSGSVSGQVSVMTYHYDNARTGLNPSETLLTPSIVKPSNFGKLFLYNVDGFVVAQPLYVPNVNIPGAGLHNVVYVETLHDSVFAFDADNPGSGIPLWQVNFTIPPGVTTVPSSDLGCPGTGYTEVGIMGTPVIDPNTGTLYVTVKTKEVVNTVTTYVHRLHALDITTGFEKFGGPVLITASVGSSGGTVSFNGRGQSQRPGLLLSNGTLFIAFGSNGCDLAAHGWIMAYDPATLQQLAVFNTSPNQSFGGSIWQSGSGIVSDSGGALYVSLANGTFDVNIGGPDFGDTFLKLAFGSQGLSWTDYFEPFDQANMAAKDLDLGSGGVLALPDQPGPYPHLLIGAGKTGTIYLVNRDKMGQYNPNDNSQIVQSLPTAIGPFFGNPAYWNSSTGNMVYFLGGNDFVKQFTLTGGLLSTTPTVQSKKYQVAGVLSLSSNGAANGIVWFVRNAAAPILEALDAVTLTELYNSAVAGTRDTLGYTPHFITPMVANGKVFVGTQSQLVVYGLMPTLVATGGNNQSGQVFTTLTVPLTVQALSPYTGSPIPGVTVTFSDSGRGGTFSNSSGITDSNGKITTDYSLPKKSGPVSISATSSGYTTASFSATAVPGPATALTLISGGAQSATVGTTLPKPLVVKLVDAYGNGIPATPVTFSDGGAGGSFLPNPINTDTYGQVSLTYSLPTVARVITITAAAGSLTINFKEMSLAGAPASLAITNGNNQTKPPSTVLPIALTVLVRDQYGNPVPGISVSFSDGGAGGTLSSATATTAGTGKAFVTYATPPQTGDVTVTASVTGLTPVLFAEHVN